MQKTLILGILFFGTPGKIAALLEIAIKEGKKFWKISKLGKKKIKISKFNIVTKGENF